MREFSIDCAFGSDRETGIDNDSSYEGVTDASNREFIFTLSCTGGVTQPFWLA